MTRIIYGYSGEGSGHSTRAREMAHCLIEAGHTVKLCSYDRGYINLKDDFDVLEIEGLTLGSRDNRLSLVKTFTDNLSRMGSASDKALELRRLFKSFQPQVVITDFEPMTAFLAHHYSIPLISLDNQHRMRYLEYEIPSGLQSEAALTRAIIRMMILKPDVSLITSLVDSPTKNDRTFVFPPMISQDVREQTVSQGSHLLVYVTKQFESLIELLARFKRETFIVYGSSVEPGQQDNVQFLSPNRAGFLAHLASCKAVIGTAGFTLISEALYLKKPYLAFPIEGQYEQELNAFQIASMGCGRYASAVQYEAIGSFLYDLPEMREHLDKMELPMDNSGIRDKLIALVENDAKLASEFRALRKGGSSS